MECCFESTGRDIVVSTALSLVKNFGRLYVMSLCMEVVDTFPDVRHWSEVLCCTILIHMSDL